LIICGPVSLRILLGVMARVTFVLLSFVPYYFFKGFLNLSGFTGWTSSLMNLALAVLSTNILSLFHLWLLSTCAVRTTLLPFHQLTPHVVLPILFTLFTVKYSLKFNIIIQNPKSHSEVIRLALSPGQAVVFSNRQDPSGIYSISWIHLIWVRSSISTLGLDPATQPLSWHWYNNWVMNTLPVNRVHWSGIYSAAPSIEGSNQYSTADEHAEIQLQYRINPSCG